MTIKTEPRDGKVRLGKHRRRRDSHGRAVNCVPVWDAGEKSDRAGAIRGCMTVHA